MSDWNINNQAHFETWIVLKIVRGIDDGTDFSEAAKIKMKDLEFWPKSASKDINKVIAGSHASLMHNYFIGPLTEAVLEKGVTRAKAIAAISEALLKDADTVNDLADVVDDSYRFNKEK